MDPWWLVIALGVVVVALLVVLEVRRQRAKKVLAEREARHAREAEALRRGHDTAASEAAAEADRRVAVVERDRDTAVDQERTTREFFARGAKFEAVSRELLTGVCHELGLDAVLVTNLVFVPREAAPGRPFVAQVDHVLLLDDLALVVENKHWQGVVLDGIAPADVHPALGVLLGDAPAASFGLQLKRGSDDTVAVLSRSGGRSPATQVRTQARRVSQFVANAAPQRVWFDTCVLYSHPDALVHRRPVDKADSDVETHVAAGLDDLRQVVSTLRRQRRSSSTVPVQALAQVFAAQGAEIRGFGAHADLSTPV